MSDTDSGLRAALSTLAVSLDEERLLAGQPIAGGPGERIRAILDDTDQPRRDQHTIRYVADDGETVVLSVPWGFHTGRIPPPEIVFPLVGRSGDVRRFRYAGGDGDDSE